MLILASIRHIINACTPRYILVRARVSEHWKLAMAKLFLDILISFIVVFNPAGRWPIDTSNPLWQLVRWALPRVPVTKIWVR